MFYKQFGISYFAVLNPLTFIQV